MRTKLRIYVDHGEAYGNLGDEAMLLNALRRLEFYLGPCEFVLPQNPGNPLPNLPANVHLVSTPWLALYSYARYGQWLTRAMARIPGTHTCRHHLEAQGWRWGAYFLKKKLRSYQQGLISDSGLNPEMRAFLAEIKRCDVFYGVGAADFTDFCLGPCVVYKAWLYETVRPWVKVSAVGAQGIGPLNTPWARRLSQRAFSFLDLLSFRDFHLSEKIVSELKPQRVRYRRVGDEAFSLPVGDSQEVARLIAASGLPPKRTFVAVHFRTTDYVSGTASLAPQLARILDNIAVNTSHDFIFFPLSYHSHSGLDQEYGGVLKDKMVHGDRFHIAPAGYDVRTVKGAVGLAKYSLGLSYHLHVFALSQGHPAIILYTGGYYEAKSMGLAGFYGKGCFPIDLNHTQEDAILNVIGRVEKEYLEISEAIRKDNEEIERHNDWTYQEMARLLDRKQQ